MSNKQRKAEFRWITVDEASSILEKTDRDGVQRPLYEYHVDLLSREMLGGRWECNGEPIILDNAGRVLDGQHRLWAAVTAEMPMYTLVVEGVEPSLFPTITDQNLNRQKGDMVAVAAGDKKMKTSTRRACGSAAVIILGMDKHGRISRGGREPTPSNRQVLEWTRLNPDIISLCTDLEALGKPPMSLSLLLAIYWLVYKGYPDALDWFFSPLITGLNVRPNTGVHRLRDLALTRPRPAHFTSRNDQLARLIKAWNADATGQKLTILRYAPNNEYFPVPIRNPSEARGGRRRGRSGVQG